MKTLKWGDGSHFDDPNLRWGNPSYRLEPGDPGYVPPTPPPTPVPPKTKTKRNYMASNATPQKINDLITAGEDLCKGLHDSGVAVGIKQNTFAVARPELDALIATEGDFTDAEGAEPAAYAVLRDADNAGYKFIGTAVKVLSVSLGNSWSDAWLPTGLPDNTVGIPRTQDGRYAALGGLKTYFTKHPDMEINTPKVAVTAALAGAAYDAITVARGGVAGVTKITADKKILRDAAMAVFSLRYHGTVGEIGQLLGDTDPRWYDFGLNRPADPAQPAMPTNVVLTVLGGGRVQVDLDGARRAHSLDFYRQIIGVDPAPVKAGNFAEPQFVLEALPVGKTVAVTVTGVNDAGEGPASDPVSVVVT